jgi:hypothetical protein
MRPLGLLPDPCDWPTLAIVDDARLTPDRTWTHPVDDAAWTHLRQQIQQASEAALGTVSRAPDGVLAERALTAGASGLPGDLLKAGARVRGRLWLLGVDDAAVDVHLDGGQRRRIAASVPVCGEILAFLPWRISPEQMIDSLARNLYPEMVRRAARVHGARPDVVAHLRRARDASLVTDEQIRELNAAGAAVIAELTAITPPGSPDGPGNAEKLTPEGSNPPPARAPAGPPPPAPPHEMQPLADALTARLVAAGGGRAFADVAVAVELPGDAPIVFTGDRLWLDGSDPLVRRIAALHARPTTAALALDLLAAHAATVVNDALEDVTDATELYLLGRLLSGVS